MRGFLRFRLVPLALLGVLWSGTPVRAAVSAPVLKWAYGGCFSSWCQTGWYSSPAVADLDGDGQPDVIWGSYDVVALNGANGTLKWRAANPDRVWPGIAVADLTGDGTLEVIVGRSGDQVTVYNRFGTEVWTRHPFGFGEVRTLAVSDLENDGQLEIVAGRAGNGDTLQLNVFEPDGTVRPGWPARHNGEPGYGSGMYNENVAVADMNGDGFKEVFGPTDTHYITALDRNGSQLPVNSVYAPRQVWSEVGVHVDNAVDLRGYAICGVEHRPNFANSAPTIADVNGDGVPELIVIGNVYNCGTNPYTDLYYMPFILKLDRTRWSGSGFDWTAIPSPGPGSYPRSEDYNVIENVAPNAVVADLDGDGRMEILYASYDGKVHAYWLDKTEHGSWPYVVPTAGLPGDDFRFASEPVVADLDNDGHAEVIFTSWPKKATGGVGQLHILNYLGQELYRVDLPAPRGNTWNGGLGAPTLANIDADGDLEVVVGTVASGVVAYDLPNTANARVLWGTGRGSYRRAGTPGLPALSIGDVAVSEGNAGAANAVFTVSLSAASGQTVTVNYATANGTAAAGSDYTATSGTLTFLPGVLSQPISVPVLGDNVYEPNETFVVNLSGAVNALIAHAQGVGTILNDDPVPSISINDVSVPEGNAGTTNAVFNVSLSNPSSQTVTVSYQTADGTATAGSDYGLTLGTVTFAPLVTAQTISVPVIGDRIFEGNETFFVNLSAPVGATIADGQGVGTIIDDDPPGLSVNDVTAVEGTTAVFTVTLSPPNPSQTVTVNYITANGSAMAGSDYAPTSGTLTFPPGTATRPISVGINADALVEGAETFSINLSGAVNAAIAYAQGIGTILDPQGGGDFNGDGKPDILWRSAASGGNLVWLMNGTAIGSGVVLTSVGDPNWQIVGTADFNGDGKTDILWRNAASGANLVWLMNGTAISSGVMLAPVGDPSWQIVATGDFNADGKPDILWRNQATGDNLVWLMNGTAVAGGAVLTAIADANWKVGGVGDFNADGKPDILWRNQATGDNLVWFMNGTSIAGGAVLTSIADVNWRIVGVGDFNADGKPDILWRNQATGDDLVWLMNGTSIASGAVLTAVTDTGWRIVGPR